MTAISKKGGKKNKKEMYKKNGKKESTNAANRLSNIIIMLFLLSCIIITEDNTTKDSVSQQRRVNKEKAIRKHDPNWEDRRRLNRLYSNLINNTTSTNTTNAAAAHHDDVNDNKKSDIVEDILKEMMTKGINNYILNHSGSRIVQACMKYGTMDQRKRILTTLSGEGLEDAILQGKAYGMLAIERLISYGIKTDKKLTINTILKPLLGDRKIVSIIIKVHIMMVVIIIRLRDYSYIVLDVVSYLLCITILRYLHNIDGRCVFIHNIIIIIMMTLLVGYTLLYPLQLYMILKQ